MATTTQIEVGKDWVKLSDGDCTVQANSYDQLQFAVSTSKPTTDAALLLHISEPANFGYQTPIWCRQPLSYTRDKTTTVNVVK